MAKTKTAKKPAKKKKLDLEALLQTVPPEARLSAPETLPVKVAVLEAERAAAEAKRHAKAFAALPTFDATNLERLQALPGALDDAERAWQKGRTRAKLESTRGDARAAAEELRRAILAAATYFLRADPGAEAELARIREGDGVADLAADLRDLAELLDEHPILGKPSVGLPSGAAAKARALAATLAPLADAEAAAALLERRNALWWLLVQALREVRLAARFLFRGDPKRLGRFTSAYEARRRRAKAAEPAPPAPPAS